MKKVGVEYELPLVGIANGHHEYRFNLDQRFFEFFGNNDFENADIAVELQLQKQPNLLQFNFKITGTLQAICDRCGDNFALKIWEDHNFIGKFTTAETVEKLNEEDSEILYFSKTDNYADISTLLLEIVLLSLPIQVIHPMDASGKSTCNQATLLLLDKLRAPETPIQPTNNSLQEQLKKLKTK
jgi:uncharacterized metal-binding protein YceD (DUF177 family)